MNFKYICYFNENHEKICMLNYESVSAIGKGKCGIIWKLHNKIKVTEILRHAYVETKSNKMLMFAEGLLLSQCIATLQLQATLQNSSSFYKTRD